MLVSDCLSVSTNKTPDHVAHLRVFHVARLATRERMDTTLCHRNILRRIPYRHLRLSPPCQQFSILKPRLSSIPSVVVGKRHIALAATEAKRLAVCNIRTSSRRFRGQSSTRRSPVATFLRARVRIASSLPPCVQQQTIFLSYGTRRKQHTHSFPPSLPLPFIFPFVSCSRATSK
jgi:hypothetical protein